MGRVFLAPSTGLVPVPETISDEAAAQLIAMPFSAITLLDFLGVESGDWAIQNTANGAVGKTLAMLAKARGVNVVNLVRRDAGVDELTALGIDHVVSTASDGWKDKVRAIVGEAPIRAAVDSIGGQASGDLIGLWARTGFWCPSAPWPVNPCRSRPAASSSSRRPSRASGAKVSAAMPAQKRVALIGELLKLVASGDLKLPVEAVFGLDQVSDAVRASLTPGKVGKVLLRP